MNIHLNLIPAGADLIQKSIRPNGTPRTKTDWNFFTTKEAIAQAISIEPELEAPIARLIEAHPDLETRAAKAAMILVSDALLLLDGRTGTAWTRSSDGRKLYMQTITPIVSCTCPDFRQGQAPKVRDIPRCKHLLALSLAIRAFHDVAVSFAGSLPTPDAAAAANGVNAPY